MILRHTPQSGRVAFSGHPSDKVGAPPGPSGFSNLYFYGYGYYDPVTGRWPSSDPIEYVGGLNLYYLFSNNELNKIDGFGLERGPFIDPNLDFDFEDDVKPPRPSPVPELPPPDPTPPELDPPTEAAESDKDNYPNPACPCIVTWKASMNFKYSTEAGYRYAELLNPSNTSDILSRLVAGTTKPTKST